VGASEHVVRDLRQVRALSSPVRGQILNALADLGPRTVKELAAELGRLPSSLYYHVRLLEQVGLLVEVERRRAGPREEVVYGPVAERVRLDTQRRTKAWRRALAKSTAGALELAKRQFEAALEDPSQERRSFVQQRVLRLDARGLKRVVDLLSELPERTADEQADAGRCFTLTVALTPARPREDA
jgi:DNA-binding transcriptional ArsR family regulator